RHFPQLPQALPSGHAPWTVLLELSDAEDERHAQARFEALLGNALSQGVIHDTAVAQTLAQSQGMWHVRDAISLAQGMEGLNIKHDIAVPVSGIPAFVHATDAALAKHWPGVRMVCFGHLGDGNLHYNVQAPAGQDAAGFLQREEKAINTLVYDAVCAAGGSISAEHGIGQLKREELARRKDPTALAMMRAIKQALDPQGLMNPGRVL
ncbi:MAG: hydroxyacid dehydrogenase, partial [Paucibacter sp.]|nr:hydroxyacid dehydrogenase [Roseateles sp.]